MSEDGGGGPRILLFLAFCSFSRNGSSSSSDRSSSSSRVTAASRWLCRSCRLRRRCPRFSLALVAAPPPAAAVLPASFLVFPCPLLRQGVAVVLIEGGTRQPASLGAAQWTAEPARCDAGGGGRREGREPPGPGAVSRLPVGGDCGFEGPACFLSEKFRIVWGGGGGVGWGGEGHGGGERGVRDGEREEEQAVVEEKRAKKKKKLAGEEFRFRIRSLSSWPRFLFPLSYDVSRSSGNEDAPWGVSRDIEVHFLL